MAGTYQASSGSEIQLNAMNIPPNSVKVSSGGIALVEGQDYTVDYTLGRVKILNQGLHAIRSTAFHFTRKQCPV